MAGPRLTDAYLGRLRALATAAGIDGDRFVDEVADHLAQAVRENVGAGLGRAEAERRAVECFGRPHELVEALAGSMEGGAMRKVIRKAAGVMALAGTAALVVVHVAPSQTVAANAVQGAVAAGVALAGATALAVARDRGRSPLAVEGRWTTSWLILWLVSVVALGGLTAWGWGEIGVGMAVLHQGGRLYAALFAALVLLVVGVARLARAPAERAAAGPAPAGLAAAGLLGLLFNGIWTGTWKPFAGIGEGQGNPAIVLIVLGWALAAIVRMAGPRRAATRERIGLLFVRVGERLRQSAPVGEATSPG